MAQTDEQRKVELLQNMAVQRNQITTHRALVTNKVAEIKEHYQQKLNVPERIKDSIKGNPKKWFIISAIGGLVISKVIFGKKKFKASEAQGSVTKTSSGMIATAAAFALKPILKSFVINKVKDAVARKYLAHHQDQHQEYYEQQLEYDERPDLYTVE